MSVLLLLLIIVSACTVSAEHPNVLLLCIDDLRPELASFGAKHIHSPNIDALAARGRAFHRHYVQAPTCGASRYALLTGRYGPYGNDALFERAKLMKEHPEEVPPSLPAWFRQNGYTTVSVGKISHHPGGRGGPDWDDPDHREMPASWDRHILPSGLWQHPRGVMHGLAHGKIRSDTEAMVVYQSEEGDDSLYPDGLITNEAVQQLKKLAQDKEKPFFLAVGIIRPHLPFGAPANYVKLYEDVEFPPIPHPNKPPGRSTWHASHEFARYDLGDRDPSTDSEFAMQIREHYAACVSYADALAGRLLNQLEGVGVRDDTIVVLWGDHGWHLGEHAIWGKHALFEESLRSPLIIAYKDMPEVGVATDSMVETIDLFPTLCDLADLPKPDFLHGKSLLPILEKATAAGHPAVSYRGDAKTIRTHTHRLIAHDDGYLELYDHRTPEKETRNLAEEDPETADRLLHQLQSRLPRK